MNDNTALFLFDFDDTLVGHSHNYIGMRIWNCIKTRMIGRGFESEKERDQAISDLTKEISLDLMKKFLVDKNSGWKNPEKIKTLMQEILKFKHKIGIVSFNNYPYAIKYAMEQLLGKEDAEKIYIKSGLPYNYKDTSCNKVPYILEVMRKLDITNKANIFFMDDDLKNIIAAQEFGIQTVYVRTKGIEHINKAFEFLHKFNEKYQIYVDPEEPELSAYEITGFNPIDKNWADDDRKILGEDA